MTVGAKIGPKQFNVCPENCHVIIRYYLSFSDTMDKTGAFLNVHCPSDQGIFVKFDYIPHSNYSHNVWTIKTRNSQIRNVTGNFK